MMNLEANIFPVFELPDGESNIKKYLSELPQMERVLVEAPLDKFPVVTLAKAEFDDENMKYLRGVLDNYQFVITRRFKLHEEWHVGGANGEILNVYTFISGLKTFLEGQLALRDSTRES